jgi:hypothetical protein
MARKGETNPALRRMLSLWEPPEMAGRPVGVLATTFTLDTALFEEECLARFAGVQCDPDRDGALYRIEREEKLAGLLAATVVADIHHCGGQRSLRWDLLAARPEAGVQHAKISVLAWENAVRVLVSSANLTESGYRRNQECLAVLAFSRDDCDGVMLGELTAFLREILGLCAEGAGRGRAEKLLDWLIATFTDTGTPRRGLQRKLVLIAPGRANLFDQLSGLLPANGRADSAHVVSPFFDTQLREDGPEHALWQQLMRQRGSAKVHFHIAGEHSPEAGIWRLFAPEHLAEATPQGRGDVDTLLHPILVNAVDTADGQENRPLHAKSICLEHDGWLALCLGSSNFTSSGTGLSRFAVNYEANVVYVLRADSRDSTRKALRARLLEGERAIPPDQLPQFAPAFDNEGEGGESPPALPRFFGEALLTGRDNDRYQLRLSFKGSSPAGSWQVSVDRTVLTDNTSWIAHGSPETLECEADGRRPPPSVLHVQWQEGGEQRQADWPVNVESSVVLPVPEELKGLTLAALLGLLSSARPLSEALRHWLRRQVNDDDDVDAAPPEIIDPHAKVDTSGFLMKRVQRACWAITHLAKRLAEPALTPGAMSWRLYGPAGAQAVVEAIRRQCDPDLPDEWAFLLRELLTELQGLIPAITASGDVETESRAMLREFAAHVAVLLQEAESACSAPMRDYLRAKRDEEVV